MRAIASSTVRSPRFIRAARCVDSQAISATLMAFPAAARCARAWQRSENASGNTRLVCNSLGVRHSRPIRSAPDSRVAAPSPRAVSVSSASRATVRRRMRRSISIGGSIAAFQSGPHAGFGSSADSTVRTAPWTTRSRNRGSGSASAHASSRPSSPCSAGIESRTSWLIFDDQCGGSCTQLARSWAGLRVRTCSPTLTSTSSSVRRRRSTTVGSVRWLSAKPSRSTFSNASCCM